MNKKRKFLLAFLLVLMAVTLVVAGCTVTPSQPDAHECGSVCVTCGKCTDKECGEDECADKCKGHSQLDISKDDSMDGEICYHSCPVCGKCADPYSSGEACAETCECDGALRLYKQEAEDVTCNGNPKQGGKGLNVAKQPDGQIFSGGYQIEGTDLVKTSDGIYFKWSITVESDCEATINIGGAGMAGTIENKNKFALRVDGKQFEIDSLSSWTGFEKKLQKLVTFQLKAGENIVRLYLLGDGSILNIDYFDFIIAGKATFNECAFDDCKIYEKSYVTEAENAVTNGTFTVNDGLIEGLEEIKTEDAVYFKWSVNADEACEVTLALYGAGNEKINLAEKFNLNLNNKNVQFESSGKWTDGKVSGCDLATFNLEKGENKIFLFVLENSQQLKLDKFVFGCDNELTFNPVTTEGEVPEIKVIRTYKLEAENSVTNGFFAGGLTKVGEKVENFSAIKTEQGVYFKWLITPKDDCEVTLSFYANAATQINFSERFLLKVNGTDVVPQYVGDFQTWIMATKDVVNFNLKAGEETLVYLYVLTDTAGDHYINIDKFIFKAEGAELTFNETALDPEAHKCVSACEECGKCTNAACTEEVCKEKCEGHNTQIYKKEAETTVTNGLNGGGLLLSGDGTKVENFSSIKTEDGIYFKWSITASADCKVTLSLQADGISPVNFADRFLLKVGETEIVPTTTGNFSGFVPMIEKLVEFDLKANEETVIYLFILTDESGDHYINIDKFIFKSEGAELTFNETAVDAVNEEK